METDMKPMTPAHHVEAVKRAVGKFSGSTFVGLDELNTDQALVQAYQDYRYTIAIMSGMNRAAANLLAISQAEKFSEELPALKTLFRRRLDGR